MTPNKPPSFNWILVKRTPDSTVANENGTTKSLNPSSNEPPYGPYHWEERDAGTKGGYEVATFEPGTVTYNPSGHEAVVFGWREKVPHSDGFSAMTEDPL